MTGNGNAGGRGLEKDGKEERRQRCATAGDKICLICFISSPHFHILSIDNRTSGEFSTETK